MRKTTTFTALLLLAAAVGCADTPDAPADTPTEPEAAPAPPADHAGYVPGNRIDAFAVNCKLCDERAYIWGGDESDIATLPPDHPTWLLYLTRTADAWERLKAERGPSSDWALYARDRLVWMRRIAMREAEGEPPNGSLAAVAARVERTLLDGGAVK